MKLWHKGLIGCAIGCGVLGVAAGVAFFGGLYWAFAPGEQVATERIVGVESVGAVQLDPVREDAGARAVVDALLRRVEARRREQQRTELPENLRWTQNLGGGQGGGLGWLVPRDATVALETVEGFDQPQPVLAVNLATFPRMFRWMLTRTSEQEAKGRPGTGDPRILNLGTTRAAFFESTLLVAKEPAVLATVLARLDRDQERRKDGTELSLPSRDLLGLAWREQFDLYGAIRNQDGALEAWLAQQDGEWDKSEPRAVEASLPVPGELLVVRFGVDFQSADRALAVIEADCASQAGAEAWAAALAEHLRHRQATRWAGYGVRTRVSSSRSGVTAHVGAEIEGLEGWIDSWATGLLSATAPAREPSAFEQPVPFE